MASLALTAKREGVAQAYALWVSNVTGSRPTITRLANGRRVDLTPAQIEAMSADIYNSMQADPSPDDLNVSMPWGAIMLPAITKKYWPFGLGFIVLTIGVGYILGSGSKSQKKRRR